MSSKVISINIPTDSDGFISLQCPFCKDKFKLTSQDFQSDELTYIFCPYCGLQDKLNNFITDEVREQIKIIAMNEAKSMINNSFKRLQRKTKSNTFLSLKLNKSLKMEQENILFEIDSLEIAQLNCCKLTIKVDSLAKLSGIYCPLCGLFN